MPPDFFELEGSQLGLVVRDATVKGMPAALVMATTCGMLRAVAQSSNSPGEVLRRVNEALSVRIPQYVCHLLLRSLGSREWKPQLRQHWA
jgi:serine phosphatase RsbU (regulator of sigma subunit)